METQTVALVLLSASLVLSCREQPSTTNEDIAVAEEVADTPNPSTSAENVAASKELAPKNADQSGTEIVDDKEGLKLRLASALVVGVKKGADLFFLTDGVLHENAPAEQEITLPPGPSYIFSAVAQEKSTIEIQLYNASGNLVDSATDSGGAVLKPVRVTDASVTVTLVVSCDRVPCRYALVILCMEKGGQCGMGLKEAWEAVLQAQRAWTEDRQP